MRYISHEMRTPLNIVLIGTKICISLLQQCDPGVNGDRACCHRIHEVLDTMQRMLSASDSAILLLNELLLFANLSKGILMMNTQLMKVGDLIAEAVRIYSST